MATEALASLATAVFSLPAVTNTSSEASSGLSISDKISLGVGIPAALIAFTGIFLTYLSYRETVSSGRFERGSAFNLSES
jgi:hypothetical protein